MTKHNYFEYNEGKDITKGAFRISASQLSKFFDSTNAWYRENFLGEGGFEGNTGSTLGNCVHAGVEMYVRDGEVHWDQIDNYINSIKNPEIDTVHIQNQVEPMLSAALDYVSNNMPTEVEKFVFHEIIPGYGAGGSIDALMTTPSSITKSNPAGIDTIVDWKTTSQKSPITKFSRNYWFQQYVYAYVLKQQGIDIKYLKLVFITNNETGRVSEKTGKPLKDYPSQVYEVVEEVTNEGLAIIESSLKVIAESAKTFQERPELRHLLAQDWRLKEVKPKLFID